MEAALAETAHLRFQYDVLRAEIKQRNDAFNELVDRHGLSAETDVANRRIWQAIKQMHKVNIEIGIICARHDVVPEEMERRLGPVNQRVDGLVEGLGELSVKPSLAEELTSLSVQ